MGNNNNFRHISDGINLVPNATTEVTNPGDIDYSTNNGQFNFLTGSGLEQIIGTIAPQTLINKTISVSSNFITGAIGTAAQFNPTTGNLEASITTSTELGYVHGVTSSIQTQLNTLQGEITAISSSYVSSLNSLTGAVSLTAGSNITITPSGNSLIITSTGGGGGSGTVTSVTFTGDGTVLSNTPSSPVTTSGTLTATLNVQSPNTILAGPATGITSLAPTFRSLVSADIPLIPLTSGVSGVLPIANGGTNNGSLPVTAGGVLYTDGTEVQNVGAGTSGYVLQSNGGSAPSWVPQSGGGGIGTVQVSSSCGSFQAISPGALTPVTNLSINITTSGKPILITMNQDNSGSDGYVSTNATCQVQFLDNTNTVQIGLYEMTSSGSWPGSSFSQLYFAPAGTYNIIIRTNSPSIVNFGNLVLIAYEF